MMKGISPNLIGISSVGVPQVARGTKVRHKMTDDELAQVRRSSSKASSGSNSQNCSGTSNSGNCMNETRCDGSSNGGRCFNTGSCKNEVEIPPL